MKIYYDVDGEKSVVFQMSNDEAKAFEKFLQTGLKPKEKKPLPKSAKGYKIAKKIADEMCVW